MSDKTLAVVDLATKSGRKILSKRDDDYVAHLDSGTDLRNFIDFGREPLFKYNDYILFIDTGNGPIYYFKKNAFYFANTNAGELVNENYPNALGDGDFGPYDPIAFSIPLSPSCLKRVLKGNKKPKHFLLLNGDEDAANDGFANTTLIDDVDALPSVSFQCLCQFYEDDTAEVNRKIAKGKFILLDYTLDQRIELTSAQKKVKKKIPPEAGFTLSAGEDYWHRSGTVLLYDTEKRWTILVGQDEGTYFGVQLAKKCETIEEAYENLIPEAAKGKQFMRQGEWFAVPVNEKDVPELKDCAAVFDSICLGIESNEDNRHSLTVDDDENGRIGKDGVVYVYGGELDHSDHATMNLGQQWYSFHRNTAVRSYSQEGVD